MRLLFKIILALGAFTPFVSAAEFTVSSYNCGALSGHYDYIRAVAMHKLMQMRYKEEPKRLHQLAKIEETALKILFAEDAQAKQEWEEGEYQKLLDALTASPEIAQSCNQKWFELFGQMLTSYKVRPIVIYDPDVEEVIKNQIYDLTKKDMLTDEALYETRRLMAQRIFEHELNYDIVALQEADFIDPSLFPGHYAVAFSPSPHSVNGIAWNTERFELADTLEDISGKGFAVILRAIDSEETVLVISAHLSGCNPFMDEQGDSEKGNMELRTMLDLANTVQADIKILAMDSNVTATHPRLKLLKEAGFIIDSDSYLEPTCSSPYQIQDTRIDWIAVQSGAISNIPVCNVGLNSPQTNMSDHKPIAARITSQAEHSQCS